MLSPAKAPERRSFPVVPVLLLLAAGAFVVSQIYHVLLPFLFAFALAYVLNPLVERTQSLGLRREVAVVALYLLAGLGAWLAAGALAQFAVGEFKDLQLQAPAYLSRARAFLAALETRADARLPYPLALPHKWELSAGSLAERAGSVPSYLIGVVPLVSLLFLVPFISFFALVGGPDWVERFIQFCPSRYVEQAVHLISDIDSALGNYVRGLIVVAAAISAASFLGLVLLGVDQALFIALLAGFSSFVPYLGAIVGAVVGGLIAGFQFGTVAAGLKVVVLFAGIRAGDEMLLQPFMAKHSVHLHPLVFLATFMIGGELFGFVGLLFAVPVACILKALVSVAWSWYSTENRLKTPDAAVLDAAVIPYT